VKASIIPWKQVKAGDVFLYGKMDMTTVVKMERDGDMLLVHYGKRYMRVHPDALVAVKG
jgi:hypothetical protein